MSKSRIRGYILLGVLFLVFTVMIFALPFEQTNIFWLAYLFAVVAIVSQIFIFNIAFSKGKDAKSVVYGMPIARVGLIYLVAQIAISLAECAWAAQLPVWAVMLVNVFPLAFAIVGCVLTDEVRDEVNRQENKTVANTANMRAMQSASVALVGLCTDADLKKKLQNLADEFKYSDPVSVEATISTESDIAALLEDIKNAVAADDTDKANTAISKVLALLLARNAACKANK